MTKVAFERLGRVMYERGLAAVKALIDPFHFQVLWTEGQTMGLEQAIEYALTEIPEKKDAAILG